MQVFRHDHDHWCFIRSLRDPKSEMIDHYTTEVHNGMKAGVGSSSGITRIAHHSV